MRIGMKIVDVCLGAVIASVALTALTWGGMWGYHFAEAYVVWPEVL